MLRWVTYLKSLNPNIRHISARDNAVTDMLSKAWFGDDVIESDNEDASEDLEHMCRINVIWEFREEEYEGEILLIGKALQDIKGYPRRNKGRANTQRKKRQVRKFFVNSGLLRREPKRPGDAHLRVLGTSKHRRQIMSEFHESD